jgi:hypothetical protein
MTVNYDELVKSWANAKLTPQPPATQCRGHGSGIFLGRAREP